MMSPTSLTTSNPQTSVSNSSTMSLQTLFHTFIPLLASSLFTPFAPKIVQSDNVPIPNIIFGWLDDKDTFIAGDIATIEVRVLGNFNRSNYNFAFSPNITVNNKLGNSSLISGLSFDFGPDLSNWRITFTPIMVGLFNVLITDDHFHVFDSSLHFRVNPGRMYPSACVASWMGLTNEFLAGTKANVLILPKDAFGNNVSLTSEGPRTYNFTLSAYNVNGSTGMVFNVTFMGWDKVGFLDIEFVAATAGSFLLHVAESNQTLNGSPLPFKVNPGALDVSKCVAQWNVETNSFQIFSKMETFIHQQDQYGNLVPGLYAFDVEVIQRGTNLTIPIADMDFKEMVPGIQMVSFSLVEPGNFMLMISDKEQSHAISNTPYDFTVYIGYCDGMNSIINGSGLNLSVAGEVARISVFLKDAYQYPSPVELERFQVKIVKENESYNVRPIIHPVLPVNGSWSTGEQNYGSINGMEIASAPPFLLPNNSSGGNGKVQASAYDVTFTPEKSGIYEIYVFCGNIPLNGGHAFRKEVSAGEVNTSVSGVAKFEPKVLKLIRNEIVVQLMDSFYNPVLLQESKLKLEIGSVNRSSFTTWMFVENKDGLYTGFYLANEVGTYEICVSFAGKRFLPCPFGVNVYSSNYFPKAYNDMVSVWEDESIAFDVLENDYFVGGNTSIVEFLKPDHGSILQYGRLFRYTPYKGYIGNDSFTYTMSDVNSNLASGAVNISVLSIPPQFVSFPRQLQATEDVISPKFGGFLGFEIMYSEVAENISVTFRARFGTVFLAPMMMQFWQPMWSELSVNGGDGMTQKLILEGRLEVINSALNSIQYLGIQNFCGEDTVQVSTMNKNGVNDLNVPIFVEPINDPPFIIIPEFVILEKKSNEGLLIFDRQKDKFNISIGDPDLLNFPGNKSDFLVMFSVEVSSGFLSTNLPAELISTTELKLESSSLWQPIQTFVTISRHFMVKAKGIRFRGTVDHCNSIIQQLIYHGDEHGAVLTVRMNDMGNYGCYPDCSEKMSMPLFAEANVNLIKRRPMSSLEAHTLGSGIVFESIMLFCVGTLLLYFTCKCATVLVTEERSRGAQDIELSKTQSSRKQTRSTDISEKATNFTPSLVLLSNQPSNFRQRSRRVSRTGESSKSAHHSSQSSKGHHQDSPLPGLMPLASLNGPNEAI